MLRLKSYSKYYTVTLLPLVFLILLGNNYVFCITSNGRSPQNLPKGCWFNETVTQRMGTIISPKFPSNYPKDLECDWFLKSDRNITLVVKELHIEEQTDCEYDYLDIYYNHQSTNGRRFCGEVINEVLATNSTEVHLHFTSDLTFEEQGFEIQFYTGAPSEIKKPVCGGTLTEKEGVITSPNYPDKYPNNRHCFYQVLVDSNERIFLKFHTFAIEKDGECRYDYLSIYDSYSKRSGRIGKYCGKGNPPSITTTKNHLFLEFYSDSDSQTEGRGFVATYSTKGYMDLEANIGECSWSKQTIKSPRYPNAYPRNSYCKIKIEAPENHVIIFVFEVLEVETLSCSAEYVQIEQKDEQGTKIIFQSCQETRLHKIKSSSNMAIVTFQSDSTVQLSGFELSYTFHYENDVQVPGFLKFPKNATVPNGVKHAMSCIPVESYKQVRWFKDGNELTETNLPAGMVFKGSSTLEILKMNQYYVGNYSCEITDQGILQKQWFLLSLAENAENCSVDFKIGPEDSTIIERTGQVVLRCKANDENATITWEMDSEPLIKSPKFQVQENGNLVLKELETIDEGLYTCVASSAVEECRSVSSAVVNVNVCGIVKLRNSSQRKSTEIQGKIIGGEDAEPGSNPWQVMFWDNVTDLKAFCGGSLLNERWVITAAHCFFGSVQWKKALIKLGKTAVNVVEPYEFTTKIKEVVIHPGFILEIFDNDIALVKMYNSVMFNPSIVPICLGNKLQTDQFLKKGTLGTVTGWGTTEFGGHGSNTLKRTELPIVDKESCLNSTERKVTRSMFCAGYDRATVDACQGDSGGPFSVERDGRWYLAGITSWGEGCAQKGKFGFYTKIDVFLYWINAIVKL